ncbi:hypothetical protein EDD85DRAFT_823859 [Armillaria nabsnona]|nr:hypothetical protein EDD85DRAFT_823859 [Armillaria nabsnona]
MTPAVSEIIKAICIHSVLLGSANLLTAASVQATGTGFGSFVYPIVDPMGWSNANMGSISLKGQCEAYVCYKSITITGCFQRGSSPFEPCLFRQSDHTAPSRASPVQH